MVGSEAAMMGKGQEKRRGFDNVSSGFARVLERTGMSTLHSGLKIWTEGKKGRQEKRSHCQKKSKNLGDEVDKSHEDERARSLTLPPHVNVGASNGDPDHAEKDTGSHPENKQERREVESQSV